MIREIMVTGWISGSFCHAVLLIVLCGYISKYIYDDETRTAAKSFNHFSHGFNVFE